MKRLAALLLPLLLLTRFAEAQTWALPAANQQNKDVSCATCPAAVKDKPTIGYSGAIKGFVGRFLDSQSTLDRQSPLRTARADAIKFAPQRNRVYVQMGSAIFGYDYGTFFTKLRAGEMMSAAAVLNSRRVATATETFLPFDNYFHAEYTDSGWNTPAQDGQERLYDFDFDDRDLLYLTTRTYFGWGIINEKYSTNGTTIPSVTQVYPAGTPDISRLAVLKSGTGYFVIGSDSEAPSSQLWDVSTPSQPRRLGDYPRPFSKIARTADMTRVAMLEPSGAVVIHSAAGILNGAQPYGTFRGAKAAFRALASDGTNFYAASAGDGFALVVTEFLYNAATSTYVVRDVNMGGVMIPDTMTANAGYIVVTGTSSVGTDMRLLKLGVLGALSEPELDHYIARYYTTPSPGYVAPGPFIQLRSGIALQQGDNVYLAVNAHALGDVYLLEGSNEPPPPPPCLPLDAAHIAPDFHGTTTTCSASAASPACHLNELVTFDAQANSGYRFDCGAHTFRWTLPGNTFVNDKSFQHAFAAAGDYSVTLDVTQGTEHFTKTFPVHVTAEPPPACPELSRLNISYNYSTSSGSCTPLSGQCGVGESVAFSVDTFSNYHLSCGPHTFAWSVNGTVVSQQQAFSRSFPAAGDYPMRLAVGNGVSTINLDFTVHVGAIIRPPVCGTLSPATVSYAWHNAAGTCSAVGGACPAAEAVTFDVESFNGYNFALCPHTFTWTVNGETSTQKSFQKTFASPGQYNGSLVVSNGETTYQGFFTVTVGPAIKVCGTMTGNNVLVQYTGPDSGCSEAGGHCVNGELVAFKATDVHPSYDFSCAVHSYTWNFGDGTAPAAGGVAVAHSYPIPGDYKVSVTVQQGSTSFTTNSTVRVRSPHGVLPISNFDFSVAPYFVSGVRIPNGYVFTPFAEPAVDTVTWSWDFGDGTRALSNDYKGVVHVFATDADFTVTLLSPESSQVRTHTLKMRRRPGR
jgi:PKD repeat protein